MGNPFLFDDVNSVQRNEDIRSLSNLPALMGFQDGRFELRPNWLRDATYALEYAAVGATPILYHVSNTLLHAAAGLLAYFLIGGLFRDRMLGWWSAALFIVHPINTEMVAHISGRRGLLTAICILSALVLLQGYSRKGGIWKLAAAVAVVYLGTFSKVATLLVPLAFVVVDFHDPARSHRSGRRSLVLRSRILYIVLLVVALGLTFSLTVLDSTGGLQFGDIHATVGEEAGFLLHARLVGMALRLLIAPIGQSVDYSFDALETSIAPWSPLALLDLSLLVLALALTAVGLMRRNPLGFAGLWFLIFLLPHIGAMFDSGIFAERHLYLSAIGACCALAALLVRVGRLARWNRVAAGAGLAALALLSTGTVLRNGMWESGETLWLGAVARYPSCARAHKALGDHYLKAYRTDLALEHYGEAVRVLPAYKDARVGKTLALMAMRKMLEARDAAEELVERWPEDPTVLNLNGYIQESMGDNELAMEMYQAAVDADPTFAEAYNNMGRLYAEAGDISAAIEMYETALVHDPGLITALQNLAVIYRHALGEEQLAFHYEEKVRQLQEE
jgi:tetratricopeptide (TPR) repeat protein